MTALNDASKRRVSIVVPVYNVEAYLDRCVRSITEQSYGDIEIILINDGSADQSGKLCDAWSGRDSRIHVIHQKNSGIGSARNTGIAMASGSYLMFVDSDDCLPENAVEVLLKRLIADGSDMVVGRHADLHEDGSTNGEYCRWMKNSIVTREELIGQYAMTHFCPVAAWGKIYRREVLSGRSFPTLRCGEDLWLYPAIVDNCNIISIVEDTVYYYFIRDNSITHKKTPEIKQDELMATLHFADYLYKNGEKKGCVCWFIRAVNKALEMERLSCARTILRNDIGAEVRQFALRNMNIAARMKWLCLYIEPLYPAIKVIKKILGKG